MECQVWNVKDDEDIVTMDTEQCSSTHKLLEVVLKVLQDGSL